MDNVQKHNIRTNSVLLILSSGGNYYKSNTIFFKHKLNSISFSKHSSPYKAMSRWHKKPREGAQLLRSTNAI
jgi:hypothetical protein